MRSMSVSDAASPLWPRVSPSASTTWSAALAAATASATFKLRSHSSSGGLFGGSLSAIVQPWANVAPGLWALMPS